MSETAVPAAISSQLIITESVYGVSIEVRSSFDSDDPIYRDTKALKLIHVAMQAIDKQMRSEDTHLPAILLGGSKEKFKKAITPDEDDLVI